MAKADKTVDNTTPVEDEVLEFKSKKEKKDRVVLFKIDDEEFTPPQAGNGYRHALPERSPQDR